MDMNDTKLSKELSYALRHAPWEYGLELDEEGWVSVEQLLDCLHQTEQWKDVQEADLHRVIETSEKKRHELRDGKIRAYYGHSVSVKIHKEPAQPPEVLYHGTARKWVSAILQQGLQPKNRQYVHLSQDVETALAVGRRRDHQPCILVVDAKKAWEDGIVFYLGNETVWLADAIPGRYLKPLS